VNSQGQGAVGGRHMREGYERVRKQWISPNEKARRACKRKQGGARVSAEQGHM